MSFMLDLHYCDYRLTQLSGLWKTPRNGFEDNFDSWWYSGFIDRQVCLWMNQATVGVLKTSANRHFVEFGLIYICLQISGPQSCTVKKSLEWKYDPSHTSPMP